MSAINSNPGGIGFLDNIRLNNGVDCLKNHFHGLLMNDSEKCAELLNDENLQYCSLYSLQSELEAFNFENRLNERNRTALRITRDIVSRNSEDLHLLTQGRNSHTLSVFRWILGTGYPDDSLSDEYETVMEHAAIQLCRTYRDTSLLNEIAEMTFSRNKKELLTHYLIWAFFEARSTYSLHLIANRLCSVEKCDRDLARKLLAFVPCVCGCTDAGSDGTDLYREASDWIRENQPFMFYTGESLHEAVNPLHYDISLAAKYMCRSVSVEDGSMLRPVDDRDCALTDRFNELDTKDKKLLSDYSYLLYRRNVHQWNTWIRLPMDVQMRLAAALMGGAS